MLIILLLVTNCDYPKINEFDDASDMSKTQFSLDWGEKSPGKPKPVSSGQDKKFSESWNQFKLYAETNEFIEYWRNFSGIDVNKMKFFRFVKEPYFRLRYRYLQS